MKYEKTIYVNGGAPYLSAENLNKAETQIETLSAAMIEPAVFQATESTATCFCLSAARTDAPTAIELPMQFLILPTIGNGANLTIRPSWTESAYPVRDLTTGAALSAGAIRANQPVQLLFDGTAFWVMGGGGYLQSSKLTAGSTTPAGVQAGLSVGDIYIYCPTMP